MKKTTYPFIKPLTAPPIIAQITKRPKQISPAFLNISLLSIFKTNGFTQFVTMSFSDDGKLQMLIRLQVRLDLFESKSKFSDYFDI